MAHVSQIRIPATYVRGGTSKGVFFRLHDLPARCQQPGEARDRLLLRVIGSPDPYGKQTDGMGGATSSTSKTVILSNSERPGHDIDYLFGQVSIDQALVDWSGNCGNLSAAVGPMAIRLGLLPRDRVPADGVCTVRIWQANIGRTIVAHVPITGGEVQETGDFELDGVAFPAAEVRLEFLDPAPEPDGSGDASAGGALFPTGALIDVLAVRGVGRLEATMIDAGIPTIFVDAAALGYKGTELQDAVNSDAAALARLEAIRTVGALRMGLIRESAEAARRQHTPKIAFVAPPADYLASSGRTVRAAEIDVLVRAMSMGKLHHAMMGTASVAIAAAAAVPGTLVARAASSGAVTDGATAGVDVAADGVGPGRESIRFGHPSGALRVGAQAERTAAGWRITKAVMSRSARVLMDGWVHVPGDSF